MSARPWRGPRLAGPASGRPAPFPGRAGARPSAGSPPPPLGALTSSVQRPRHRPPRLGIALLAGIAEWPPERRNTIRYTFLHPTARTLYPDWRKAAADSLAQLRLVQA